MRSALSVLFLTAACGGAAANADPATPPTPSASASPSATTADTAPAPLPSASVATAPPASQAFCPAVGKIKFVGGGTSMKDPIKIIGAKGEMDGTGSEYTCLDAAFGSRRSGAWKLLRQALLNEGGKNFDLMSIELADGTKKEIIFDISDYFGKF